MLLATGHCENAQRALRYTHGYNATASRAARREYPSRAESAEEAEKMTPMDVWPDAGRWPAFKGTLELRTQARRGQVALVFSIPVCPSPREARSGQIDEKES